MSSIVELQSTTGRQNLLDKLDPIRDSNASVLPAHGMLQHLIIGAIDDAGHVYVDKWPNFNIVVCTHAATYDTSLKDHLDLITGFVANASNQDLVTFLRATAEKRAWGIRRSVLAFYATEPFIDSLITALTNGTGSIKRYGVVRMFLSTTQRLDNQVRDRLQHMLQESAVAILEPRNWKLDHLRPDEASTVLVNHNAMDVPSKDAYYHWLIDRFKSACIRDEHDQPVAWVAQHSCGAGASRFVLPEHRRLGLNALLDMYATITQIDRGESMAYGGILETNSTAAQSFLKHSPQSLISKMGMETVLINAPESKL